MVRPRKDADKQDLRGNPGKKAKPKAEAKPAPGAVVMPKWLCKEAVEVWKDRAPTLIFNGLLHSLDTELFGRYCQCVGLAIRCERELAKSGTRKQLSNNVSTPYPEKKDAENYWKEANKLAPAFGITSAARSAKGIKLRSIGTMSDTGTNASSKAQTEADARKHSILNRDRS